MFTKKQGFGQGKKNWNNSSLSAPIMTPSSSHCFQGKGLRKKKVISAGKEKGGVEGRQRKGVKGHSENREGTKAVQARRFSLLPLHAQVVLCPVSERQRHSERTPMTGSMGRGEHMWPGVKTQGFSGEL